jgi:hypothetical protein
MLDLVDCDAAVKRPFVRHPPRALVVLAVASFGALVGWLVFLSLAIWRHVAEMQACP